jgi:long-chain acyl-CoA synthetase
MAEPRTLCDAFFDTVDSRPRADALCAERDGAWMRISTAEVGRAVEEIALGLRALGVGKGDKVVLLSENRPEWLLLDYAILTLGAVTVPIYATLNARDTAQIVRDSDAIVAVVSDSSQAQKLLAHLPDLPLIRHWILMAETPAGMEAFVTLGALREKGREEASSHPGLHRRLASEVQPADLASLVYTSGTTGQPKGVMLTHANFVRDFLSALEVIDIRNGDRSISVLPLSHAFQRLADFALFYRGVSLAYVASIDRVSQALGHVRPTVLVAVPRLFEKIYGRMLDTAARGSYLKKVLVHWGVRTCREWARQELEGGRAGLWLKFQHKAADALVSSRLRKGLGGRLRIVISGGAPLGKELGLFFYGAGVPITEGYGLTESAPIIAANPMGRPKYGSIGIPVPGVDVRIDEDGELLARGPNIMQGYYKLPEATAEALTQDGWLRTGDIARLDEDGYIFITDRKKELLVTAGGKKVAPQPIENLLKQNKYVSQAVLVGDGRPFVTALLVPNWENVFLYTRRKGLATEDREALCVHPQVRHLFQNVLDRANVQLSRFEQVKRCAVLAREFSQDQGELTPTMKCKRRVILQRYSDLIEGLYGGEEDERQHRGP